MSEFIEGSFDEVLAELPPEIRPYAEKLLMLLALRGDRGIIAIVLHPDGSTGTIALPCPTMSEDDQRKMAGFLEYLSYGARDGVMAALNALPDDPESYN